MKKILVIITMIFCLCHATNVSGSVSGTWSASNSPYYVTGNVIVSSGASLTIDPGVEIIFNGDYFMEVDGTLTCNGTSDNIIQFRGADNTKQGSIILNNTETAPSFSHCKFKNLNEGILYDDFQDQLWDDVWNKELNEGFEESVYSSKIGKKVNFFNLGFNNRWQKLLPLDIKKRVNEKFKENLEELNYLNE